MAIYNGARIQPQECPITKWLFLTTKLGEVPAAHLASWIPRGMYLSTSSPAHGFKATTHSCIGAQGIMKHTFQWFLFLVVKLPTN